MIDVVAAVLKKNNKYFIAQRNRNKHFGFHWEFPGGKVDESEDFEKALKREILEELFININIVKKITSIKYEDEKINIILHYFLCEPINIIERLSEHEDMRWLKKSELLNFNFAPGDSEVIKFL